MLKSGESSPNLLKLGQNSLDLGQIFIDPKDYRPNLVKSGQIWRDPARFWPKSGDIGKPETFFLFVYFLNKVDVQVSLSFQGSQTENYLTHVIMIISFAEI